MARIIVFDEFGDADVLSIVDEPISEPGAAELRVKIEAFGVNRLDQMMRAGQYPAPIRLPHAHLGVEGTGTVDAVGSGVEGFSIGDHVIITAVPDADVRGTYAEYVIVRPTESSRGPTASTRSVPRRSGLRIPPLTALSSRRLRCNPVTMS